MRCLDDPARFDGYGLPTPAGPSRLLPFEDQSVQGRQFSGLAVATREHVLPSLHCSERL